MNNFYTCIAEICSMTSTMRAQSALSEAAIPTTIVKGNSSKNSSGCAYGLSFDCAHIENIKNILAKSGVKVRRWKDEI